MNHIKQNTLLVFFTSMLIFLPSILFNRVYSQIEWIYSEGSSSFDVANEVVTDGQGNTYVIGKFEGEVDFDPGPNEIILTTAFYDSENFIQKIDPLGNLIWVKKFGDGTGEATIYGAAINNDNELLICGSFANTINFDTGSNAPQIFTSIGSDSFILKTTKDGDILWIKTFGEYGYQHIEGIDLDLSGNIYTTGVFTETIDLDPSSGQDIHISIGLFSNTNVFVQKLSPEGEFIWGKSFGGDGTYASDLEVNQLGDLYVLGYYNGNSDFDPSVGSFILTSLSQELFLVKLNSNGDLIWVNSTKKNEFEGGSIINPNSIDLDEFGNIYTNGNFTGSINFGFGNPNPEFEITSNYFENKYDAYLVKINPFGDTEWVREIGGTETEYGLTVDVSPSGQIIWTVQYVSDSLDVDPSIGTSYVRTDAARSLVCIAFDLEGNYIWNESIEGFCGGNVGARSVSFDRNNGIYVVGSFVGYIYLEHGGTPVAYSSDGYSDAFFMKLNTQYARIDEFSKEKSLKIYPNPANNNLQVVIE